jgi:type III pantothenate kinase
MQLLVDIGNTHIKWAQLINGELAYYNLSTYKDRNIDLVFDECWGEICAPSAVYVANVGCENLNIELSKWISSNWLCPLHIIQSTTETAGVTNGYDIPAQLGVDRWLAVIAAHHMFKSNKSNICIFDCGTAITMDLININGLYLGGLIFPGLSLLRSSLVTNTANCNIGELKNFDINTRMVATNTSDGILLGSLSMVISLIKYQHLRLIDDLGFDPMVIITGGDAPLVVPYLSEVCHHLPHLVLEGISIMLKNNE